MVNAMSPASLLRPASLALGLSLLGACAGRYAARPQYEGGTQLVATDEPLARGTGAAIAPQPIDSSGPDPLRAAMSRMVASDGAVRPLAWKGVGGVGGLRCRGGSPLLQAGPLVEPDLRAASLRPGMRREWWFIGLTLDPEALWLSLDAFPCGASRSDGALASRLGRMAPEVAGRDTSVLFTTRRATREPAGAGMVGAVIEQFIPAARKGKDANREARPRPPAPAAPAARGATALGRRG
jgi:hypothetical protein